MPPNDVPFTALPPLAEFTLGNWQAPHTTPFHFQSDVRCFSAVAGGETQFETVPSAVPSHLCA